MANLYSIEELEKLYSRGYYLYETGNFPKAVEMFQELITIDPTYPPYLQGFAASLQMNQEYHRAVYGWSMLIHLDPIPLLPYVHLAESLISMQAIKQALQVLQTASGLISDPCNANDTHLHSQIALLETRWSAL